MSGQSRVLSAALALTTKPGREARNGCAKDTATDLGWRSVFQVDHHRGIRASPIELSMGYRKGAG